MRRLKTRRLINACAVCNAIKVLVMVDDAKMDRIKSYMSQDLAHFVLMTA